MKRNIIREGDKVRIINPEVFVRCGYPWDKKYVIDNIITNEQKKQVAKLIMDCGLNFFGSVSSQLWPQITRYNSCYEKLLDELAYYILITRGFGGRERKIITRRAPEYQGKTGTVWNRRVYRTGTYCPGGGSEDDYCPTELINQKSHVVFNMDIYQEGDLLGDQIWIENIHLQKI
jgi:hypothetical protein